MARTVMVGLDALSIDMVRRLCRAGELPAFSRLMTAGAGGACPTTTPSISPAAWVSLYTGKWPGTHGIFHFFRSEYRPADTYQRDLIDYHYVASRAITVWEILERNGIPCGLYNVPFTYPLPDVSGFVVGNDFASVVPREEACWPAALATELRRWSTAVGYGGIEKAFGRPLGYFPQEIRNYCTALAVEREKMLHLVRSRRDIPFLFLASTVADGLQHWYARAYDAGHPCHHDAFRATLPAEKFRAVVPGIYRWYDELLTAVQAELSEEDTLIVVSDHGSSPAYKIFSTNRWLWREGYLTLLDGVDPAVGERGSGLLDAVDWGKTRVCDTPDFGLRINLRGREPQGIVAPDQFELLRGELVKKMRALVDIENGKPILSVQMPQDVYEGPYADQAPDIVLMSRAPETGTIVMNELTDIPLRHQFEVADRISSSHISGEPGIFFMRGPGVAVGAAVEVPLVDVVPSLCARLGVPYPQDCDGVVRSELTRGVPLVEPAVYAAGSRAAAQADDEAVINHLRGLGYF